MITSQPTRWSVYTVFAALLCCCSERPDSVQEPIDAVLLGGTVYNCLDEEPVIADVGIEGDRIVAIGNLKEHPADLRLDVTGLVVAPGFIDIHSHARRPQE